jgi:hypothetical protein
MCVPDNIHIGMGNTCAAPDYWFEYNSASTQLELHSTDCNGTGTDCVIMLIDDGASTDVRMKVGQGLDVQQTLDSNLTNVYTFDADGSSELTAAAGTQRFFTIWPELQQTVTAATQVLALVTTDTSSGTGQDYLIYADWGGDATPELVVQDDGDTILGNNVCLNRSIADRLIVSQADCATMGNLQAATHYFGSAVEYVNGNGYQSAGDSYFSSRAMTTAVVSGDVEVKSGNQSNIGNYASGSVTVRSGTTTTDGLTGNVILLTGASGDGTGVDAGDILLQTNGANTRVTIDGTTGNVALTSDLDVAGDITSARRSYIEEFIWATANYAAVWDLSNVVGAGTNVSKTGNGEGGIVILTTGAVADNYESTWSTGAHFSRTINPDLRTRLRLVTDLVDKEVRWGLSNTPGRPEASTRHVLMVFDESVSATDWYYVCTDSTDTLTATLGVGPTAGTLQSLRIDLASTGTALFYVDAVLVATVPDCMDDATAMYTAWSIEAEDGGGGAAEVLEIDHITASWD